MRNITRILKNGTVKFYKKNPKEFLNWSKNKNDDITLHLTYFCMITDGWMCVRIVLFFFTKKRVIIKDKCRFLCLFNFSLSFKETN